MILLRLSLAGLLAAAALVSPAFGQSPSWPSTAVRVVIPYPPGSAGELLLRSMAQRLSSQWRQSVVVDNRPGANTIIGAQAVIQSPSDGHTLLFTTDSTITTNPHIYTKLPYDPIKDFVPISLVATFEMVLVGSGALPANSIGELVALAKAQPGQVTVATLGTGSQHHIVSSLLSTAAGVNLLLVPYKGIPQANTALLSGEVQLSWGGAFPVRGHVLAKRLKAFGVAGSKRSTLLPDAPTFAEAGFPSVDFTLWWGLFAPTGTPRPVIERIHADVTRLINDAEFREKEILPKGYAPGTVGLDAFATHIKSELASRAAMVKQSGARVE